MKIKIKKMKNKIYLEFYFSDIDSFYASELARSVDFIDCCAPSALHAEFAYSALERGYHVLCEKPLALDRVEAQRLREIARRTGRTLMPVHNYRYAPVLARVTELLRSGAIGPLSRVLMEIHRPSHARGVAEWDPHWRRILRWSGGGVSVDHGSHALYLVCNWFNLLPVRVDGALSGFGPGIRGWQGTEEDAWIEARFPVGGIARIGLSWRSSARRIRITLVGERGAIFVDDSRIEVSRPVVGGKTAWVREERESDWDDASHARWLDPVLSEFLEAIERNDALPGQSEIALHCAGVFEDLAITRASAASFGVRPAGSLLRDSQRSLRLLGDPLDIDKDIQGKQGVAS
jgi:predicted dehydrogenase